MAALIEARDLVKRYGTRAVVNGISLVIEPGEVIAIIGPNGAGKSTLLELILGLRVPDGGAVTYWQPDPRREIGVQLQSTPFFRGLSAAENLDLFAAFYGVTLTREARAALLRRCGLAGVGGVEAARLSGGQQKRLAIAIALAHHPRVVFLDEPTAALDPRARREIRGLIGDLATEGAAVVFTSHDMEEVGKIASRVVLITDGRIRTQGTPRQLLAQHGAESLEQLYLDLTPEDRRWPPRFWPSCAAPCAIGSRCSTRWSFPTRSS